jgi:hypothetical protein
MQLSADERVLLEENLGHVQGSRDNLNTLLAQHRFSNVYTELAALYARQESAMKRMLAGEAPGETLESLRLDVEVMIIQPHAQNLKFVAQQLSHVAANKADMWHEKDTALHTIKSNAGVADIAYSAIKHILKAHARVQPRVEDESKREL